MKDKYLKQLVICLTIINNNSKAIKEIWDKEIKEREGYLDEYTQSVIDNIYKISTELLVKYKNISWELSEHKTTVRDIYNFMSSNNSSKKQKQETYGYNFKEERGKLPEKLLDSTISISYTMNYLFNKLKLTVDRQGISDNIEELFEYIKTYTNFTEEELILNLYKL